MIAKPLASLLFNLAVNLITDWAKEQTARVLRKKVERSVGKLKSGDDKKKLEGNKENEDIYSDFTD